MKRGKNFYVFVLMMVMCGALLASCGGKDNGSEGDAAINPISSATFEEIQEAGYRAALPETAQTMYCNFINMGSGYEKPMAEIVFSLDETEYTLRALKTDAEEDISGLYYEWNEEENWDCGDVSLKLHKSEEGPCFVEWYDGNEKIQWCLSADAETRQMKDIAEKCIKQEKRGS